MPSVAGTDDAETLSSVEQATGDFWLAMHQETVTLPLALLTPSDSPRSGGVDAEHVRALAEVEARLPPITVHRPTMRVVDGMHRLKAAQLRGDTEIEARLFEGTHEDAFVLAVGKNVRHGLPLTFQERSAAAVRIMSSHPAWSDRRIAETAGLSAKTVADLRQREFSGQAMPAARTGRDGRVRPVSSAAGRERAAQFLRQNPTASLREVAKAAGISPGTVRNVRDRLTRGQDPVPPRQRMHTPASTADARPLPSTSGVSLRNTPQEEHGAGQRVLRDFDTALQTLRKDPSLRFTDAGRLVLRLLETRSVFVSQRNQLLNTIPQHCMPALSAAIRQCAESWHEFAEQLDRSDPFKDSRAG
ncbi:ParB N-terminal domain-containing protein [Streptomyces sp. NPDC050315]|uniref:ParB and winged helix-turn-helix domain-containing protein n=1 Tax=Streptomyces sp. NPDC050315 TaxID=3155039 RepID=UPI00342C19EC